MLRTLAAALLTLTFSGQAYAGPVVVWLESTAPDDKQVRKVEGQVGEGGTHLCHLDLAFPPQPVADADDERYAALRATVDDARAKWTEFDVELEIANAIEEAISQIDVVRDQDDARELADARLVQGAAVSRAFSSDRDFPPRPGI